MIAADAKQLFGLRVRVDSGGGREHFGILQGIATGGDVTIWDEETDARIYVGPVLEVEDARHTCARCGKLCNAIFGDERLETFGWCADCFRPLAQRNQEKPTCQRCGAVGSAVRNPRRDAADKGILCRRCHVEVGNSFSVPASFTRESIPLGLQERAVCAAANVPGTVQCEGAVKPRRPTGEHLCNAHAGRARLGERR